MAQWNSVGQVASILQLAGVDAYGLIKMIVEAVQTVKRNKETCQKLAQRVEMIGDLLQQLDDAQLMQNRETRNPVEQLATTLRRAYVLIVSCQNSSYVYSCFKGGSQADQLRELENDIALYLQLFPLVGFVDTTRTWESAEGAQIISNHSGDASRLGGRTEILESGLQGENKPSADEEQQFARKEKLKGQEVVHKDKSVKFFCAERSSRLSLFNFSQILNYTDNFNLKNCVGRGAFGYVFKGKLPDGLEIAVKRHGGVYSRQGSREFTAEIETLANLQHNNIIRLVGFCIQKEKRFLGYRIQGEEIILVYEYMPNKSLDSFIHGTIRGESLTWSKRLRIIEGIAQGLVYLHEHSCQCVVHRDLKPSNILLDYEMNPKISDFGAARTLVSNVTEEIDAVIGTLGYVDPVYAMTGKLSVKSDVYSFGIILLEIISQRRYFWCHAGDMGFLQTYAWELWKAGKSHELIDPSLNDDEHEIDHIIRCIQVALLCIQYSPADRPTMYDVVLMLCSKDISIPAPKVPGKSIINTNDYPASYLGDSGGYLTITTEQGR